ncbi:hypothetical protein Ppa06_30920 [Planomonospora parontospora subsp. parontospora]|uniref:Uncharacterized protein n=2 Tax=Planomonospora parontospora TaxID=58119 RepID=A0AA37F5C3_9ACTN|nr:hypothetical protein GCM10010126_35010 [Planomonospora parontospora]GII09294.1 hypothetical protein Ppa06_30920 [Planomonospora parontospora subsp. parontospora]
MVRSQPSGSGWEEAGLRAAAAFGRAAGRLAEAVRAGVDLDRLEAPLAGVLPEAPFDVRVAMLGRLTIDRADRAEARRNRTSRAPALPRGGDGRSGSQGSPRPRDTNPPRLP